LHVQIKHSTGTQMAKIKKLHSCYHPTGFTLKEEDRNIVSSANYIKETEVQSLFYDQ
jgi:hypothetical protein